MSLDERTDRIEGEKMRWSDGIEGARLERRERERIDLEREGEGDCDQQTYERERLDEVGCLFGDWPYNEGTVQV